MSDIAEAAEGFRSSDGGTAAAPVSDPAHPTGQDQASGDAFTPQGGTTQILHTLRVGDLDQSGYRIDAVLWATRQFVIYLSEGQVRYTLPDNYEVAKALRSKAADLGGLRASIEDLRAEPCISPIEKLRAARELAWALALAFEDASSPPSSQPREILTRVDGRLRSLLKSHCRKRYAMATVTAFCGVEVVLLALVWLLDANNTLSHYALFGAFGALGSFLSVLTTIRSIDFDLDLKMWEHFFAGTTRILIGVIGAFVVALALDSSLIDPTFGSGNTAGEAPKSIVSGLGKRVAMYLIFAFIAGFSESLVPNLLRRGEQAAGADDKTASDEPIKNGKPPNPGGGDSTTTG